MALRASVLAIVISLVASAPVARAEMTPELKKLAEQRPVIELVTMGVGGLIWERHGHIALCVEYDNPSDNRCYNYGMADFHAPVGMAWGFFRGTNSFWVGKTSPGEMLSIYKYADRTVWVQPLPLTAEQKQKVIDKLEYDILDEHKYYAYDHFADNCTTRVRDIIDNATGGALSSEKDETDGKTFRDLARDGFFGMRIPLLITDIAMGRSTDRVPTYWERMFLPQYLREAVAKKWGIEPIAIYTRAECRGAKDAGCIERGAPYVDGPSGRVWFAIVILLLTAPAWATRLWGRLQRTGLAVAILPYALLGLILTALAIISPLPYVRMNESCLVLFPFDVLVLFLPVEKARLYARGRVAMLGVILALHIVNVIKQPIVAPLLWPLVPMLVVGFWPPATAAAAATQTKPASTRKNRGGRRN